MVKGRHWIFGQQLAQTLSILSKDIQSSSVTRFKNYKNILLPKLPFTTNIFGNTLSSFSVMTEKQASSLDLFLSTEVNSIESRQAFLDSIGTNGAETLQLRRHEHNG
jgi:hypothetical protein